MSATPDQYGVVGHPVSHSWSPFIHGLFAKQTGQELTYRLFDVAPEDFDTHVREFFEAGGRGLNVTVPHKLAAAGIAGELTPRARRAGAVNTLARQENGLLGDNTDGAGLVRDLQVNLELDVNGCSVLVVGAGGAARGVVAPLLALSPKSLVIANRTVDRALALASEFADLGPVEAHSFDGLPEQSFGLVINATSASLAGDVPAVPAAVVGADTVCYDMAYGKLETAFTRWASAQGCKRAVLGWGMLVEQAAESFQIWRGIRPDTAPVLRAVEKRARLSAS